MEDSACQFWALLANVAQVVGVSFAGYALLQNATSVRQAYRSTDAATILAWYETLTTADEKFRKAVATPDFASEFNARANLLEVIAATVNGKLLAETSAKHLREVLIKDLAVIETTLGAPELLATAVDSHSTFSELTRFYNYHRNEIKQQIGAIRNSSSK